MVRAYHSVGTGRMEPAERAQLFDEILQAGVILPADRRVARGEMEARCFDPKGVRGFPIPVNFPDATTRAFQALEAMAREAIATLPEDGTAHTMFTCIDLLAGDLSRVFLTVGRGWFGNIQNGFIFDVQDILQRGARYRDRDIMDDVYMAIQKTSKRDFTSVSGAKRSIQMAIRKAVQYHMSTGQAALEEVEICIQNPPCVAELTWEGPLPLDYAIEGWQEGVLIYKRDYESFER